MGMRMGYTADMDAGYAEIGAGTETVSILAHVDVVDIGDPSGWPFDPFTLTQTPDGFLHGRGVVDDKGPVVMCLYALKVLMELGAPFRRRLRLIVGTREEDVWTDMAHYIAQYGMPDFGFSPDGDFPIFNIERGYCDMHLVFREAGRLMEIEQARAGESPNSVPSRAYLKLSGREEQAFFRRRRPLQRAAGGRQRAIEARPRRRRRGLPSSGKFLDRYVPGRVRLPARARRR